MCFFKEINIIITKRFYIKLVKETFTSVRVLHNTKEHVKNEPFLGTFLKREPVEIKSTIKNFL